MFEAAHGGTLFLDEVGDLPLLLQPKLLRVLESREIRRIGKNESRKVDVRVLAATNRSLAQSVNKGDFREDLYYRLAVVEVHIPPLRARREDIPLLARHFYSAFTGRDEPVPPDLLESLVSRPWPGNVRELRNVVERSVALGWASRASEPTRLMSQPPPAALEGLVPVDRPLKEAREAWTAQFELLYVVALLRRTGGHVTRAAEIAGINRRTLQRLMADRGVRAADYGGVDVDDTGDE